MGCSGLRNAAGCDSLLDLASSSFCFLMGGSPFSGRLLSRGGRNGLFIMIPGVTCSEMVGLNGGLDTSGVEDATCQTRCKRLVTCGEFRPSSILQPILSKAVYLRRNMNGI